MLPPVLCRWASLTSTKCWCLSCSVIFISVTPGNDTPGREKGRKIQELALQRTTGQSWQTLLVRLQGRAVSGTGIYPVALKDARLDNLANITITCTDNIKSRLDLWNILKAVPVSEYRSYETPLYWMDFGNTQDTGQFVLGTIPKKKSSSRYPNCTKQWSH